ncbi:electron transfer flavoprotein subunit beta [Lampropedia cohaerens]|uniref:Electron transfer flavoprotein subunit alpha n=1 Tax=Lampropedia cohaerens TaxID=1610491 RepID=A0A0U1PZY3_9BURK|nr:FAD-binding protein [Lampropedia cohaerens]KKW68062.1 electron transfer flavoprotein subunit beta [Lampropedia cohaerens]
MKALIIATHDGQQLDPTLANVITAALPLATDGVAVLVVGHNVSALAQQAAALAGVTKVLQADAPQLAHPNAETLARQVTALAAGYDWVLAAHSLVARAALPRAAAQCKAAWLTDVIRTAADALERPAYAGAVIARVKPLGAQTFLTVRASAYSAAEVAAQAAPVEAVAAVDADTRTQVLGTESASSTRPDLARARIIISGGRGVGSAENMTKLEALADHLGAAVGASRAAVDAGFAPNSVQIGQTGKVVAPELYVALGISGAIQHLAGMKDSKCIVAINKDPEAPIFQIADFGVTGDLFEALPQLQSGLPAATA